MKCTKCGQECFDEEYPQVVFHDDKYCICEECSIDYEENDITGKVQYRKDLEEEGCIEEFNEVMIKLNNSFNRKEKIKWIRIKLLWKILKQFCVKFIN